MKGASAKDILIVVKIAEGIDYRKPVSSSDFSISLCGKNFFVYQNDSSLNNLWNHQSSNLITFQIFSYKS